MHEMIRNGYFGYNEPMVQSQYPYMQSNIIQVGGYGDMMQPYPNQPYMMNQGYPQQQPQQGYYNPYGGNNMGGYQQQNNGFVFSPVQQYNQAPRTYTYQNPYMDTDFSKMMNQPVEPYYNSQYGYGSYYNGFNLNNGYGYSGYPNYRPFYNPEYYMNQQRQNAEYLKELHRKVAHALGKDVTEEFLSKAYDPKPPTPLSAEEREVMAHTMKVEHMASTFDGMHPTSGQLIARDIRRMSSAMHEKYDTHSLCTFLSKDLPEILLNEWEETHIIKNADRDLSKMYNSKEYNELLALHASSNPYINQILDNSRYDNNIDDLELGLDSVYDKARRRKALLEGKLPKFLASPEIQKKRQEWTDAIMQQVYAKEARRQANNNV